jgi:hypothetical protein
MAADPTAIQSESDARRKHLFPLPCGTRSGPTPRLAHRGYEVHVADGWSCDCEEAPIVATNGDETVLVAVISAYEEGSAGCPSSASAWPSSRR